MRRTNKDNNGLGKALKNKLQKKRFITNGQRAPMFYQQSQENQANVKKMKMQSILDQNSLTDFLQVAQLSQQDFHANRNIRFRDIREELTNKKIIMNEHGKKINKELPKNDILAGLQVPRRPNWHQCESKQALEKLQNQAYLSWRRKLAEVEQSSEDVTITPYEKNVQVWRQLWRVVERVHVLVQIVDGRNPLFFYSEDLITYGKEVGRSRFLIVVNKSDLLQQKIRAKWNEYFKAKGIDHCFFTAKEGNLVQSEDPVQLNTDRVLSPQQLIALFHTYTSQNKQKPYVEIGLTGYPNVGKSSVINTLLGKKKVAVAAMPGKTKHFQTLKLTETVTLCDCPGLVFPKVHQSKAEMLLNGLYPIDTIKQFQQAFELIAYRVPCQKLQQLYSLHWKENEPYDGQSILVKYAKVKGFYTGNGLPNQAQAARILLKDYVNGVLVYNHPPPISNGQQASMQKRLQEIQQEKMNFAKQEERVQQNLDEDFFEKEEIKMKSMEQTTGQLAQDDFLDIIQGKRIDGLKITKEMRKEIKFALKRGAKVEELRKLLMLEAVSGHKTLVKV